jgi:hypothetical protein
MPFILAVDQLSFILEKEKVKTIIKVDDHDSEILPRLKKILRLRDRVIFVESGRKIKNNIFLASSHGKVIKAWDLKLRGCRFKC